MSSKWFLGVMNVMIVALLGCATTVSEEEINKIYYADGVIKSVWFTKNGKLNGIRREYNKDGILKTATTYTNGKIDGMNNIYREDGSLWTKEVYKDGRLISRFEYDEEGYLTSQDNF